MPEYRQHLIDDARERVETLTAGEPRTWSEIETMVEPGRAHHEILRIARDRPADLIVMGRAGPGAASA